MYTYFVKYIPSNTVIRLKLPSAELPEFYTNSDYELSTKEDWLGAMLLAGSDGIGDEITDAN